MNKKTDNRWAIWAIVIVAGLACMVLSTNIILMAYYDL